MGDFGKSLRQELTACSDNLSSDSLLNDFFDACPIGSRNGDLCHELQDGLWVLRASIQEYLFLGGIEEARQVALQSGFPS